MENAFVKQGLIKKILIALVFIMIFNFIVPYYNTVSFADYETETQNNKEIPGGMLLVPIKSFLNFVADSILEILQNSFISQLPVIIPARARSQGEINGWLIAGIVVGGAAVVIGTIATCGIASAALAGEIAALAAVKGVVGGVVFTTATFTGVAVATKEFADEIEGEFELPLIIYSPEKIFSNEIPLFDINFINPQIDKYEDINIYQTTKDVITEISSLDGASVTQLATTGTDKVYTSHKDEWFETYPAQYGYTKEKEIEVELAKEILNNRMEQLIKLYPEDYGAVVSYESDYIAWQDGEDIKLCVFIMYIYDEQANGNSGNLTEFFQKIEKFFRNLINNEDIDVSEKLEETQSEEIVYIEVNKDDLDKLNNEQTLRYTYESSAAILQGTIASWYNTLRTLAIVALLTILVYVGIRIVLSSTAKDKAKYKSMIIDWLVAIVLIFVLHYIMSFILYINSELTKICKNSNIENVIIQIPDDTEIVDNNYTSEYNQNDMEVASPNTYGQYVNLKDKLNEQDGVEQSDDGTKWSTNYIGMIRYMAGLPNKEFAFTSFGYTIMYIALIIYTCVFTFMYLKRVLWMAFLTMISPLVAVTYPIDKANDGQAQGFKLWLKEYIFNALLQPIHYLIYTIILGSVMNLVKEHPVYAVVALGFLIPAEKFIRKMFGFEKAETVSALGGAAGAAFLMGHLKKLQNVFKSNNEDNEKEKESRPNEPKLGKSTNPFGFLVEKSNPIQTDKKDSNINDKSKPKNVIRKPTLTPKRNIKNSIKNRNTKFKDSVKTKFKNKVKNSETRKKYKGSKTKLKAFKEKKANNKILKAKGGAKYTRNLKNANKKKVTAKVKTSNTNLKNKRPSKLKNGFKVMQGYYTRKLYNKTQKWRPLRAMRRGISFAAGATLGGAIAGAATIVDPSNAEQYLTAGIYGGGKFALKASDKVSGVMNLRGGVKAFRRGMKGEKYDDIERKEKISNFKMDNENYTKAVGKYGVDGAKRMFKGGGIVDSCFEADIEDSKDIFKINDTKNRLLETGHISKKLSEEEREKEAINKAIMAHRIGETFGDITNNERKEENFNEICKQRGFSEDQIKDFKETFKIYQEE